MPRSPISSVSTAERVSEVAQAAPPSLDCPDGQAAQASLAAGRCWFAGHAAQLAGFERESWCGGQSTQAPSATRRAGPQPHASPGRLVSPAGQAVQAVAAPARCWSLGHGSQSVFAEFGTRCGGQVSQAPSFSYCSAPLHSGAKTRTTKVVSAVSPAWLVAPTEKRWRPGTVRPAATARFPNGDCPSPQPSNWSVAAMPGPNRQWPTPSPPAAARPRPRPHRDAQCLPRADVPIRADFDGRRRCPGHPGAGEQPSGRQRRKRRPSLGGSECR